MLRLLAGAFIVFTVGLLCFVLLGNPFVGHGRPPGIGPADSAVQDAAMKALQNRFGGGNGSINEIQSYSVDHQNPDNGVYQMAYSYEGYSGHVYMYYTRSTGEFRCDGITTN